MRAPPAGRPTQELAGKPFLFLHCRHLRVQLDISGYVSEVARGRGIYVGGTVGLVYHVPIVLSLALVLCPPLPEARLREDRLHLSLSDGRHTCCHALCTSFQLSTPPLAQFDGPLHVASGHRVEPRWSIARRGMCGDNTARARGDFQRLLTRNHLHVIMGCWSRCGYIQRLSNFLLGTVTERDTSSSDVPVREFSKISRLRGRSAPLRMCRRSVVSVKKSQG